MHVDITHRPSYAHLVVDLDPGESILAEPGAMVSHSAGVSIDTSTTRDGLLSSAKSMLGGESAFANEFTAAHEAGRVTLAPPKPGDIAQHDLDGETLYAVDGAFLASDPSLDVASEFGGLKSLLAGASITPLALSGTGTVFLEAFGGIERVDLDPGESYVVDNEHVVAWEESVDFDARRVGGLKSTLLSGEGLVMEFTGGGSVWYQTRGLDAFTSIIAGALPMTEHDSDGGIDIDI
ncbi:TIGR00266 family protein [Halobacterium salinarum]|uniref:TIGR00266 family protein n=1 Tax=Halobacterium salinarum TaxID=2242 RepID=UPI002554FE50|nr:TIGR00266 family protein [Halobacterium salinarum]MDL0122335.1 TIGR00266 family protein [Halobacterium salinarum]